MAIVLPTGGNALLLMSASACIIHLINEVGNSEKKKT